MKIFRVVFPLLCALLSTVSISCAAPNDIVFIREGNPLAKIYLSPNERQISAAPANKKPAAPGVLQTAIEDLNYHFERMSGTRLEIVRTDDANQIKSPAIVLGDLAAKLGAVPKATRWEEGFRILAREGKIMVAGETDQATSHGIYTLLNQLGCDWVMPGKLGEIIPTRKTLSIGQQDFGSAPDFGMRRFWYRGGPKQVTPLERAEYEQWTRRHRLGVADELKIYGSDHFWAQLIKKYKSRFDADPEMLALVRKPDGTLARQGPQIETTNPKVVALFIEHIRATFAEKGWPKNHKVTLPIGPSDGGGYSVSPESMAAGSGRVDPIIGGPDVTDSIVKLGNDILETIGDEFPNLSLGYLIYSVHADFPSRYKPHPRIYPVLAPISYSRLHSTRDPHSKTRRYYDRVLRQWANLSKEQGNRLLVYEYNWNLADNMLPFTRVAQLGEDIPYYKSLGISGVILESTKAWALNGAHDYIAARLAWNARQNWQDLLREYCAKTFGSAAPAMERYYLRLAKIQSQSGREAGSYFSAPLVFDDAYLAAAQSDVDAALNSKLSPDEMIRTQAAAAPLGVLRSYLAWHRAMNEYDFSKAKTHLDEIMAAWQKQLDLNGQFAAREVPPYVDRLLRVSTEEALEYSRSPYQIAWRFPDSLPTALDPASQGEALGFAAPEINDADWIQTKTFGSTWDAQGLGFYREGAVWYRVKLSLPQNNTQSIGLFLGGFDDHARVWLNGKYLGASGRKFSRPTVFDLSDAVNKTGENVLAIEITRHSNLNENGTGGLLRPSFVFTGPRVVASPKPGDAEYRVLPGGEIEPVAPE